MNGFEGASVAVAAVVPARVLVLHSEQSQSESQSKRQD